MNENNTPNPSEKRLPEHGTPDPVLVGQNTSAKPQHSQGFNLEPSHSSAVNIVLQWLVYVFWFWTLTNLAVVLSGVLIHILVEETRNSTWIIYAAAPLLVLLPLSIIADHYYKKTEPKAKHGFAAVVMVINAVIAALGAVGSVIGIIYALLDLALSTRDDATGNTIAAVVCTITALLSLLFFIRVLYIDKLQPIRSRFSIIVSAVAIIAVLLTLIFPLTNEVRRKADRVIEENYSSIKNDIQSYVNSNNKLPDSLDEVTFKGGAKRAIETGRVTYSPKPSSFSPSDLSQISTRTRALNRELQYELCVDWKYESNSGYDRDYPNSQKGYYSYDGHKAGKQCYTESTYNY